MKSFNFFIVASLIAILGGFIFLKDGFKGGQNTTTNRVEKPELLMDVMSYTDYSDSTLANSQLKGTSILFFAATTWCQTCSELEKEILSRVNEIPTDMTILKVDYDNDKAMNAKWSVTSQHTLVVLDENSKEVKRWIGGGFDTLLQQVNEI
ncbi:hypothetical protein COX05_04415 [candidate division WWE3 bacterium CG22_combo_CG10-13_8_21_14_all_39_12]|uniref:Thioredoxin domain-containing protein n=1 Tax=candidate division WWE3 bacterium CG22_combo_CG10-13_8_21_14_all_39_12 TaxID=1975094 RepID=A0A2H0BF26_UNCKA|nr:thioredoxin family protein [bacterium]PIP56179.1 MAG: hypothetical protein COX05_04415 [candidate division WWE3 bacterium CG22_combo_CG10-13_8_21_14_all_39_12]